MIRSTRGARDSPFWLSTFQTQPAPGGSPAADLNEDWRLS